MKNSLEHPSDRNEELDMERRKELFAYEMTEVRRMLEGHFKKYTPEQMGYAGSGTEEKKLPSVQKVFSEENPVNVSGTSLPEKRQVSFDGCVPFERTDTELPETEIKRLTEISRAAFEAKITDTSVENPGKPEMKFSGYSVQLTATDTEMLRLPETKEESVRTEQPDVGLETLKKLTPELFSVLGNLEMPAVAGGEKGKLNSEIAGTPEKITADVSTGSLRSLRPEIGSVTESTWKYGTPKVFLEKTGKVEREQMERIQPKADVESAVSLKLDAEIHKEQAEKTSVVWETPMRLSIPETKSVNAAVSVTGDFESRRAVLQEYETVRPAVRILLDAVRGLRTEEMPEIQIPCNAEVSAVNGQDYRNMIIRYDGPETQPAVGELRTSSLPEYSMENMRQDVKASLPEKEWLERREMRGKANPRPLELPVCGSLDGSLKSVEGGTVPSAVLADIRSGLLPLPSQVVPLSRPAADLPEKGKIAESAGVTEWEPDVSGFRVPDLPPVKDMISELDAIRKEIMSVPRGLSYEEICAQYAVPMPQLEIGGALSEIMELVRRDFDTNGETT